MALTVYLDSSDFSRCAAIEAQSQSFRSAFELLCELADSGAIEFRYSSVHVFEAAPVNPEAIPSARQRLRTIMKMCGTRCLVDVVRLFRAEAGASVVNRAKSDIGDWNPLIHDLHMPDAQSLAEVVVQKLADPSHARHRKEAQRRLFNSQGVLRESGRREVVALLKNTGGPQFAKYPVSGKALMKYYAYLLGECPHAQFIDALIESFSDLDRWADWYEADWSLANSLTTRMRSPAERIARSVKRLGMIARELFDKLEGLGYTKSNARKEVLKVVGPEKVKALITSSLLRNVAVPGGIEASSWEETPGLQVASSLAAEVMLGTILRERNPRNPLDSDFVDWLHAGYAPYVDVFRADAYTVSVMKSAKLAPNAKLVGRFEDLPAAIEDILA